MTQENLSIQKKDKGSPKKSWFEKFRLFVEASSLIVGLGGLVINPFLRLFRVPYLPTSALVFLASLVGLFLWLRWEALSRFRVDMRIIIGASIPFFFIAAIHLFPSDTPPIQEVIGFWKQFISNKGCKIVIGSPLLWTGPHDPRANKIEYELAEPRDHNIQIIKGRRFYSKTDSVTFDTINYMLPRLSFANSSDFQIANQVSNFLLPKTKAPILMSKDVKSYDENFIFIGGPIANSLVNQFTLKLSSDYNFGFRFVIRGRPGVSNTPIIRVVDASAPIGIEDISGEDRLLVRYQPEGSDTISYRPGNDGAIVIRAHNPYFPKRSVLIIAGFEEHGTLAAIQVLKESSSAFKEIIKSYNESSALEMVIETLVHGNNPAASRILKCRLIDER